MQTAKIDGVTLEYEIVGSGEPVICIHGAFLADTFRPMSAESLLEDRYRMTLYHRRGYAGSSQVDGPLSINQHAADCQALLRHLQIERAHVVGHSYGGSVALQLALDAPELVQTLALLEPALLIGASAEGYRESLTQATARLSKEGPEIVVDAFLRARSPNFRSILEQMLPEGIGQAIDDAKTTLIHEMPQLLNWQFGEDEARSIQQPTLSVLGGNSEALWPRFGETHRWLLEWISNAEGFIIPGTTHLLQMENPRGVAMALSAFWARHQFSAGSPVTL